MKFMAFCALALFAVSATSAQDSEPAPAPGFPDNASSIKIRVYKLALSTSAECTSPTTVFESASGVEADLVSKPTFGKGKIPDGTYRCMMIELAKNINVTGASVCTTPTNKVICNDTQQSQTIGGTTANVTCSGDTGNAQRVTLYFTTQSSNSDVDTYQTRVLLPPLNGTDSTSGIKLDAPLVYPTTKRGVLRIKKTILNSSCAISPKFSISTP